MPYVFQDGYFNRFLVSGHLEWSKQFDCEEKDEQRSVTWETDSTFPDGSSRTGGRIEGWAMAACCFSSFNDF